MNILEGARRIRKVGRMATYFAMATSTLCLIMALTRLGARVAPFSSLALMPLIIIFCIFPSIFGAVFLVAGWIVEGFAMPARGKAPGD